LDAESRLAKFIKALGTRCPYKVIGVDEDAAPAVIKKAYKKTALKLHPDRNRDKPDATEVFQVLVQANELLADEEVKSLYDVGVRKRNAAKLRDLKLNATQRAAKHDLEERELAFKRQKMDSQTASASRDAMIARLREDGERRMAQQQAAALKAAAATIARQQASGNSGWVGDSGSSSAVHGHGNGASAATGGAGARNVGRSAAVGGGAGGGGATIKVSWHHKAMREENGGYNTYQLTRLFLKYGDATVVMKKKNGGAFIAFDSETAARNALRSCLEFFFSSSSFCCWWSSRGWY
jgi:curved DNA-binding protein CbpA